MGTFSSLLELARLGRDRFEAPRGPDAGGRLFGGQLLAQTLRAAQATVGDDRDVHSLHAYFLRPGDVERPVQLTVEAVRDGRAFSSREVVAAQGEREIFRVLLSFQVSDDGPSYAGARMPRVPEPDEVTFTYDDFNLHHTGASSWHGMNRPMDIRYINPPLGRGEAVTEDQLMWMRIDEPLPRDPRVHRAGLAYLSDSTLADHVVLPHGRRWLDEGFEGASLDHAMWFHRPARADEWLLFVQTVEATGQGRGLASGRLFERSGALVATCVQEGLMRWVDGWPAARVGPASAEPR